ncbi:MAG: outer membrane beta-barrel protein [Bacteroidia bacterium]|nr:outer membrane beta-barrel protein [Bacteroidia bacterium]
MDEREANIDVLFRNGLKDYEVLPPAEVWDKISPAVRKQHRAYAILRVAAMVAVLVTLGFLTYTWNNEVSDTILNPSLAQSAETGTPQAEIPEALLIASAGNSQIPSTTFKKGASDNVPVNNIVREEHNFETGEVTNNFKIQGLSQTVSGEPILQKDRSKLLSFGDPLSKNISDDDYTVPFIAEAAVSDKKERWSIAALLSPTYLSNIQTSNNEAVRQLGSVEQPVISYAGGVALSYKVNKRFSVQSGLYYSSYGNELTGISSFTGFQNYDQLKGNRNYEVQTTNGTVFTDNSDVYLIDVGSSSRTTSFIDNSSFDPKKASLEYMNSSLHQNLSYLELPVVLKYKFIDRAIDFNIIGGMSSNLLVNNSVYTSRDGAKYEVGKTAGLNSFTFSSSLGMGFEYSFSRNLSLNLEPTFRYFLNPFHSMEAMGVHPYSFGIFSGLSYKF